MDSILQKPQFSKFTAEDIQSVVASSDKQRFHLETDADTGRLKIRANQGHSLEVHLHHYEIVCVHIIYVNVTFLSMLVVTFDIFLTQRWKCRRML